MTFEHVIEGCQCEGKRCAGCHEIKCHGDFSPDKRWKSGLSSRCRKCHRLQSNAHYHAHREKYQAYRQEHTEQIRAYQRVWERENAARVRRYRGTYKQQHSEQVRAAENARRRAKYLENPQLAIERSRAYKQAHPEHYREYARAHPEVIRTKTRNR